MLACVYRRGQRSGPRPPEGEPFGPWGSVLLASPGGLAARDEGSGTAQAKRADSDDSSDSDHDILRLLRKEPTPFLTIKVRHD